MNTIINLKEEITMIELVRDEEDSSYLTYASHADLAAQPIISHFDLLSVSKPIVIVSREEKFDNPEFIKSEIEKMAPEGANAFELGDATYAGPERTALPVHFFKLNDEKS